jgi:thiosulfate dehydrogenase
MAKKRSSGFGRVVLGFVLGIVAVVAAVFLQMRYRVLPESLVGSVFPAGTSTAKGPAGTRPDKGKKDSPLSREKPVHDKVSDETFAGEKIAGEQVASGKVEPPFGISEDVFEGGAKVYHARCASCHGTPGHDGAAGRALKPAALQLWKKTAAGGVGVSDIEVGETYRKIANGIHSTGMPAYSKLLTDTQMWQVSLLLKNADKELPAPVSRLLVGAK